MEKKKVANMPGQITVGICAALTLVSAGSFWYEIANPGMVRFIYGVLTLILLALTAFMFNKNMMTHE